MQLPDEAITYQYQSLLVPTGEEWTAAAEMRAQHFLPPGLLKDLAPRLMQVRSQVAADRELRQVPPELQPVEDGVTDRPRRLLRQAGGQNDAGPLGGRLGRAGQRRDVAARAVVLGSGGACIRTRALFEARRSG